MVKKKKLIWFVLLVFLLNTLGAGLATAQPKGSVTFQFPDLDTAKWAMRDIFRMQFQDVIKGYEDGSFRPQNLIKRQEAVVMAVRMMGLEAEAKNLKPGTTTTTSTIAERVYDTVYSTTYNPVYTTVYRTVYNTVYDGFGLPYSDANKIDSWAKPYIKLALDKKIIDGGNADFQPNKPATRLWVGVMMIKALGLQSQAESNTGAQLNFKDKAAIPAQYIGYVALAVEKGLLKGFPDQNFHPNKPVSRAEMAAFMGRTDDIINNEKYQKVNGYVYSLDSAAATLTVSRNLVGDSVYGYTYKDLVTFPIDARVKVFVGDKVVSMSEVKVGVAVKLTVKEGKVIFIELAAPKIEEVKKVLPKEVKVEVVVKKEVKVKDDKNKDKKGNGPKNDKEKVKNEDDDEQKGKGSRKAKGKPQN